MQLACQLKRKTSKTKKSFGPGKASKLPLSSQEALGWPRVEKKTPRGVSNHT